MKIRATQAIMECLLEQEVDTVFGYPGGTILNVYDELYKYRDRITHILTAHEQGASHAADGGDLIAHRQLRAHLGRRLFLLVLRPDEQEIEDRDQDHERQKHAQ